MGDPCRGESDDADKQAAQNGDLLRQRKKPEHLCMRNMLISLQKVVIPLKKGIHAFLTI